MRLPQEIIRAKRDGATLSAGEIGDFIAALTSGAVTEGPAAAFAMAISFRGMLLDERVALMCADDLRARPWPHRRNARQTRLDTRLRVTTGLGSVQARGEGGRLRD